MSSPQRLPVESELGLDPAPPEPADVRPTSNGLSRLGHEVVHRYGLIVVWAVMALGFFLAVPEKFGSAATLSAVFGSQTALTFLAMSALVTLVVGEFDLSIASIFGLTATVAPVLWTHWGNVWLSCGVALFAALIVGAVNAFFAVYLRISAIVVTLGTGTLLVGLAQMISGGTVVTIFDPPFSSLVTAQVLGMPLSFYYALVFVAFLSYMYRYTPLGRHMLFLGSNREVARLAGVREERIRVGAYLAGAFLAGLAGLLVVATQGGFDPTSSMTFLLPALAAVFLGTAVIHPGQFNPVGTLVAIYFLSTGIFGLQLLGFTGWIQNVFYGAGLVLAVTFADLARRRVRTT